MRSFALFVLLVVGTSFSADAEEPAPVPEPSAMLLVAVGVLALLGWRRRGRSTAGNVAW